MVHQVDVSALLSCTLFSIFFAVKSQYAATTVPPLICPTPGNCHLQCPLPPTCVNARNPCDATTCPNFPNAQCVTSCRGCDAEFYVNGQNVTQQCRGDMITVNPNPGILCTAFTKNICPPGVPIVKCLRAPCDGKTCPGNSYATCCNDYCGGCNAFFYANGVNVTSSC